MDGEGGAVTDPAAKQRTIDSHIGSKHSVETKRLMSESAVKAGKDPALKRTRSENSLRLGLKPPVVAHGSDNPASKLDSVKVRKIKKLLASGVMGKEIAEMFGVSPQTISYINRNITWKHVNIT